MNLPAANRQLNTLWPELQWRHRRVRGSVVAGRIELQHDLPGGVALQALERRLCQHLGRPYRRIDPDRAATMRLLGG